MEYQYGQNNENNNYTYYHNIPYGSAPAEPPKKKKKSGRGIVVWCMALSLVMGTAGGALGSGLMLRQYSEKEAENTAVHPEEDMNVQQTSQQFPATQTTATAAEGLSVKEISKMCMPSVVAITNKGEAEIRSFWGTFIQETEGSGSGVIIGKTDSELLIVTNYHVVSGSKELSVLFSYQEENRDSSDAEIAKGEIKD